MLHRLATHQLEGLLFADAFATQYLALGTPSLTVTEAKSFLLLKKRTFDNMQTVGQARDFANTTDVSTTTYPSCKNGYLIAGQLPQTATKEPEDDGLLAELL